VGESVKVKFKIKYESVKTKYIIVALCFVFLFLSALTGNTYLITILTFSSIWAVVAASFDLISAYTNQVNFGHAIFFGVGAYSTALLNLRLGLPPPFTLLSGAVAAMFIGLGLGFLCLRVKGPYLILITALANLTLMQLVYSFSSITGGEDGLPGVKRIFTSPEMNYCFILTLMIISLVLLILLVNSKVGIAFKTIRDDEIAAEAIGIDVVKYKLIAFLTSAFFTGLIGSAYTHYLGMVGPTAVQFDLTFMAIIMSVVGGWGTLVGPVMGSFLLTPLNEYLRVIGAYRTLVWSAVAILIILRMPGGILRGATALSKRIVSKRK
jgi:branched-chain amino acid transport system permease protein